MTTTKQKLNKLIIAAGQREKEKEYWLKKMAGPLEKENSRFLYDYKKSAPGKHRFNTVKFTLAGKLFSILSKISKNSDYTLNIILQAGVVVLLSKYTGSHDIVVGTSIYKQKNDGNFINTVLALRHQFRDFITFKELLPQIRQTIMEATDNRNYPIEVLARQLNMPAEDEEDFPLFDVVVLLENIHDKQYLDEIKYNMSFSFLKTNETIEGKLQYRTSRYAGDSITRIIHQFIHLLQNLLFHPDMRLPGVDIIPGDEKKQLLFDFNDTGAEYPGDKTIHRLFQEQVKRTPGYIALSGLSEKSQITRYPVSITYSELNNKSNQLARTLEVKGVESRTIVGIKAERSLEMMVGIFAILKAGAAYLPIDPVYPLERIKYIFGDSQIRLLLTQAKYSEIAVNNFDGEVLVLEDDALYRRDDGNPGPVNRSKDPVYIIYTSGSTGQPKGVIIEHQALVNRLNWMQKAYPISSQDVILQKTPLVFDVSVWELFWWTFPGASLCLLGAGEEKSPPKIIEAIQKYRVTTMHFVPSMLNVFLEYIEEANPGNVNMLATLQQVFASGEALSKHHVGRFNRLLYDKVETKLINLYGPTEATVDVSYFNCSPTALENRENIPIGKPIDNIQLYVLDRNMHLQPVGIPGELCIAGDGLARGYLNNPGLTAEKFDRDLWDLWDYRDKRKKEKRKKVPGKNYLPMQPCSHAAMQLSPHYPIYHTGDLARWLRDGNIEFLGRLDYQVKIRGFRIELGEIESQLLTHNDIKEAVVSAKNDREGEPPFLCAYIVTSSKIDGLELRQYLSGKLPDYMIPSYFMKLEKIPLTVNGKVDRKALDVSGEKLDIGVEYEAPADNLEKLIVNSWKEVLKRDKIGRNDNFFVLGGDSFRAMALVNKLGKLLGEHVYIVSVFENSTPARLSGYFQQHYPRAAARIIGTEPRDPTGHDSPKLSTGTIARARQLKPTPPPVPGVELPKNPPAVFILSSGRSGSTLLRVMLAGHPGLFSPPEMDLLAFNTLDEKKSNHTSIRTLMHVNGCSLQEAQAIVQRYEEQKMTTKEFYRMIQESIGSRVLVDKTASYARDMETLQRAEVYFENPLYIHLVRYPYGMIRSFEEKKLDLGELDYYLRKLSLSSREIAELEWLISNQNILEFLSQIPGNRHYRVRFEDLVSNPREVAEGICQFLGLEFYPEIVEPYKEKKQRMTEIIPIMGMTGGDVKFHRHQRIEPIVADAWKKYYKADFLGKETGQLAETFGYQLIRKNIYSSITPSEKKEYYKVSSPQKRLYILHCMEPTSPAYNLPRALVLNGELEKDKLEDVFNKLIKRHESLRTSFEIIDDHPVQIIHETVNFAIEHFELVELRDQALEIKKIIKNFARPFNLSQSPLLRVGLLRTGKENCVLMIDMHHIITDGLSIQILTREFHSIYMGAGLSPLKFQYKDYSQWQNSEKQQELARRQEEYWLKEFAGEIPLLKLPTDYPRPPVQSYEGRSIYFEIKENQTMALKRLALEEGVTIFMELLAIMNVLLAKLSLQEDIVVGNVVAGRRSADLERVIGMFVNTLPLRNYPAAQLSFVEFLAHLKKRTLNAFENQEYPLEDLVDKVVKNVDTSRNSLFDTAFVLQNMEIHSREISGTRVPNLKVKTHRYDRGISQFDLALTGVERRDKLCFTFEYCTKLFKKETIERFIVYFKNIAASIIATKDKKLSDIEIIPGEEKKKILYDFNDTRSPYPEDRVIQQLFQNQVTRTPDRTALIFGSKHMTYGELNEKANQLARMLRTMGIKPDSGVGILVERSIEMIVGLLGILKAGGAYLPIDVNYPQARIDYMLEDSSAAVLVTTHTLMAEGKKVKRYEGETVFLDSLPPAGKSHPLYPPPDAPCYLPDAAPANLAYIIYTSGTTGRSKGVMIQHRNVVQLLFNDKFQFDFSDKDVWTLFHSYSFDFSVWEVWGALLYSGRLIIIPHMAARDPEKFLEILKKQKVTVLNQTPSAFYYLSAEALKSPHSHLNIKYVIFGGEALKPIKLKEWKEMYPGTKLINMYGITETTVHVTYKEITGDEIKINQGNIGKSIPTLSTYVLDKDLNVLPPGIAGELCVGGEGVGRGYLNHPELTQEKFVKNPFRPGERLYHSGDLVKLLDITGEMEYLGRLDHQVKIRGYRIELGEIENRLLDIPGVKETVLLAQEEYGGDKYICAYFVSDREYEISELRGYLAKELPDYMIPSHFLKVTKIPLTPNGKLDRKALPELEITPGDHYVAPGNEIEKRLAEIWSEVLNISTIGIDDNFFELGGHSLKATILNSRIYKELHVNLPLSEIFQTPSIRELAALISSAGAAVFQDIPRGEEREYYPLSYNQSRLFILYQMKPGSPTFHMPGYVDLRHEVDANVVKRVLEQIICRHESFRTALIMVADYPYQVISSEVETPFEFLDLSVMALDTLEKEKKCHEVFRRITVEVFDLFSAPLFRAALVKLEHRHYRFIFNMHHIVSDGWSMEILKREFSQLYDEYRLGQVKNLPALPVQYKDFALWQNRQIESQGGKKSLEFWQKKIEQGLPGLQLRKDSQGPDESRESAGYKCTLEKEVKDKLKQIAAANNTSIFVAMYAILNLLLYRLSGQEDLVTGILGAGRQRESLQHILGFFVNTLIMKNHVAEDETFMVFLKRLNRDLLEILQHQDYPLELVFEHLNMKFPDIPLLFNMFNLDESALQQDLEVSEFEPSHIESVQDAKFEIVIFVAEYNNAVQVDCRYWKAVFKRERIHYMMQKYLEVLKAVAADPGKPIKQYLFKEKRKRRKPELVLRKE